MKTKSAKAKGRNLQKWVRDKLLEIFTDLTVDDIFSRAMGSNGSDVYFSKHAQEILPIGIECKNLKSIAVYKYYEQAKANARGYEPVVVIKQNKDKPLAIVDADYFFNLLNNT